MIISVIKLYGSFWWAVNTLAPHPYPQPLTVGNKLYRAVFIGTVDILRAQLLLEPGHYLIGGVAVGIGGAYGDNGKLGVGYA